jgi:hypothetical protein
MDEFKAVIIKVKGITDIPPLPDVRVHFNLVNGEGARRITGGQGNAFLGMAGGRNYYEITIFDVANKVRDKVNSKPANLVLIANDTLQYTISDVNLKYEDNNVKLVTDDLKKITC